MDSVLGKVDRKVNGKKDRKIAQLHKKMRLPPLLSIDILKGKTRDEKAEIMCRIRWCLNTREDIKIYCSLDYRKKDYLIRCKNKDCEYKEDWDGSNICMLSKYLTDHILRNIDMKRYAQNQSVN
jgi:hypothetical protein